MNTSGTGSRAQDPQLEEQFFHLALSCTQVALFGSESCSLLEHQCEMTFDEYFYASFPPLLQHGVSDELRVAFRQLAREYFDPQHGQTKDIIDRFIKQVNNSIFLSSFVRAHRNLNHTDFCF